MRNGIWFTLVIAFLTVGPGLRGEGLGDGATHQYPDLPVVVAGTGGGTLTAGRHLHCADGTPLANLWLTRAQAMGLEMDRFANSTGVVPQLLA